MGLYWAAKAPGDVREYTWALPGASSAAFTVSTGTATVSHELTCDGVLLTVTGGSAGVTQIIAATATVGDETITQTIYIPVVTTLSKLGYTARDICADTLEMIAGIGEDADAAEHALALRKLNDMLGAWAEEGADLGMDLPLVATDTLVVNDAFAQAIKANLYLYVVPKFGEQVSPLDVRAATAGLQRIKQNLMPARRSGSEYY